MSFSLSKWVCPPPETFDEPLGSEGKVEWFRCLPYVLIHLAAILVFFYPITLSCILVAFISYSVRMFSITAFYHRYFSHRSFKTSRFFQYVGAFIACSSGQRGPLWWAAHHRRHHKHSDTDDDVHSPHTKSLFWSHTLWFMTDYSVPTFLKEIPDWLKFKELRILNRFDWIPVLLLALGCYFAPKINWIFNITGLSSMQMLIWGFFVPTILLYHATFAVNSISHLFGSRQFNTKDKSKNNWLVAIFTFGEGWHNNHHFFPGSARQGFFKDELDITYYGLKLLSLLGLVRDLRPVPVWVKEKAIRNSP
jgi:stearoyl-CoA desaturase (delta-9 desaturase)